MDYIKKFMEDNRLDTKHYYIIDELAKYPFTFIENSDGKMYFSVPKVGFDAKIEMLTGILNGTFKVMKINEIYQQVIEDILNLKVGDKIITMKDGEILKRNFKNSDEQITCTYLVKSDGLYYVNDNGEMINSHGVLGKIITGKYTYKLV